MNCSRIDFVNNGFHSSFIVLLSMSCEVTVEENPQKLFMYCFQFKGKVRLMIILI